MTKTGYIALCAIALVGCASDSTATDFAVPVFDDYTEYCAANAPTAEHQDPLKAGLIKAALKIGAAASSVKDCEKAMREGEAKYLKVLKKTQKQMNKKGKYKKSKDAKIKEVQATLTDHWREDQAGRRAYLSLRTDDETGSKYWARSLSAVHSKGTDAKAKAYLESLMDDYDWIDRERFGDAISAHAWIIAQHADDDPAFQQKALDRMTPYVETGGVTKKNYAYLWDRVAVNTDKLQRYGTQPTWECTENNELTLQPLEDPDNVNALRKEMGMNTVEEGLSEMARSVCQ